MRRLLGGFIPGLCETYLREWVAEHRGARQGGKVSLTKMYEQTVGLRYRLNEPAGRQP